MNLEVQEDDAAFVFTFTKIENDLASTITTGTITILNPGGTEIVASTSMVLVTNVATHTQDFSVLADFKIDQNFQAIMVIDGVTHLRLFDIVKYPFINEVTINELENENREAIDKAGAILKSKADSGSGTTLVDAEISGTETFKGGELEIYPAVATDETTRHEITDFTVATGTFTFTPARSPVVSTQSYTARRSFAEDIARAGDIVQGDLWKIDRRAYLILDNTQINNMIVFKFFERYFRKKYKVRSEEDQNFNKYTDYQDDYKSELTGLPLRYDLDEDDVIADDESRIKDSIRVIR